MTSGVYPGIPCYLCPAIAFVEMQRRKNVWSASRATRLRLRRCEQVMSVEETHVPVVERCEGSGMQRVQFDLKRVLCPIDFSRHSAAALRMAGGLAKILGAELTVLHAQHLEAPVYFTVAQVRALRGELRRGIQAARDQVAEFIRKHLPRNLPHSIEVVEGDTVTAILRAARHSQANLVVMGTHGRSGLTKIRLGSVTDSVLRQINVPILTVGPGIKPSASLGTIRRILCPVNFRSSAGLAFQRARSLAERTGAELILINIVEPGLQNQDLEEARKALCDWVAPDLRKRCAVREVVRTGNSAEQIVAEAKSAGADLIVVGGEPRESLGAMLFGSTTEALIRHAPCPVLSIVRRGANKKSMARQDARSQS
jgi:nucleotide-binding universal stress UspA family protein